MSKCRFVLPAILGLGLFAINPLTAEAQRGGGHGGGGHGGGGFVIQIVAARHPDAVDRPGGQSTKFEGPAAAFYDAPIPPRQIPPVPGDAHFPHFLRQA